MAEKKKPDIRRSYPESFDDAMRQHLSDIYKYYSLGWDFYSTINDEELLEANKLLFGKLKAKDIRKSNESLNGDYKKESRGFPFLRKAAFYVYSRDMVHYIDGSKWSSFPYLKPLQVLDFVIQEVEVGGENRIKIASLLFTLLVNSKRTSWEYELNSRRSTRNSIRSKLEYFYNKQSDLYNNRENFFGQESRELHNKIINQKQLDAKIANYGSRSIHPIIFEKPSEIYSLAKIDQATFNDYAKLLGLDHEYEQWHESIYGTKLYVFGLNELEHKFNNFIKKENVKWKLKKKEVQDEVIQSGINMDSVSRLENLTKKYESHNLQNKYSLLHWPGLEGNRLIRIEKSNNGFDVGIQNVFFDYKFLLVSLYFRGTEKQKRIKSHIQQISSKDAIKSLRNAKNTFKSNSLFPIFEDLGLTSRRSSNFYKGFKIDPSKHFEQIKLVLPIVQTISQNGIYVDQDSAFALYSKFREEWMDKFGDDDGPVKIDDIEEFDDIKQIDPAKVALEKKLNSIKKILASLSSLHNYKTNDSRIHGLFSAHGASTHRLTCSRLNLQGISKKISERIFSAPPGRVLISADVSGQDIVVAAHMAQKLYQNPELFNDAEELRPIFTKLNDTLNESIQKLKDPSIYAKPKNLIYCKLINSEDSDVFDGMTVKQAVEFIKKIIFTKLFGGGKRTITNQILEPQERVEIIEELRERIIIIEKSFRFDLHLNTDESIFSNKLLNNKSKLNIDEIYDAIYALRYFKGEILNMEEVKKQHDYRWIKKDFKKKFKKVNKKFNKLSATIKKVQQDILAFDFIEKTIKLEYPGILEAFEYYHQYYIENHETFPTLLNWSTIIDFPETMKDISSISKSYPIQASSAEYMRQWLLELSKDNNYKKKFLIVNTIHDQVLIETSKEYENKIKDILFSTSKEAAMNVGINSDTLHIEFEHYPKLKSDLKEISKDDICL